MAKKAENALPVSATKLTTEDLGTKRLTAGKLTELGQTFTLRTIEAKMSEKNGQFYILTGELEDGGEVEVVFSSKKLHKLVAKNWDILVNRRINISGEGTGFDREYSIQIME